MEWTVRSHGQIAETAREFGLDAKALEQILGYPNSTVGPAPAPLEGCPPAAVSFWAREYVASEGAIRQFENPDWTFPDPFGVESAGIEPKDVAFVPKTALSGIYLLCELERFGADERTVITAKTTLYSRVSIVIFPAQRLVLHFLAETAARSLAQLVESGSAGSYKLEFRPVPKRPSIAYLDMVTNHGHQYLNSLSGLQRLVDSGVSDRIEELWISGVEFYGPVERIFPEFEGKVRRFGSSADLAAALGASESRAFRVGCCFAQSSLRDRIAKIVPAAAAPAIVKGSAPLVVISLREGSRDCSNLVETILAIVRKLRSQNKSSRIVLDGWVLPGGKDGEASNGTSALARRPELLAEIAFAEALAKRLPKGVVAANLIGKTMLESLSVIQHATAYFSHVGTLQHKIANFSGAPGMVHGPVVQLQRREAGHYLTESGVAPVFLDPQDVIDATEADDTRNGLAVGYSIRDPEDIARRFVRLALGRG